MDFPEEWRKGLCDRQKKDKGALWNMKVVLSTITMYTQGLIEHTVNCSNSAIVRMLQVGMLEVKVCRYSPHACTSITHMSTCICVAAGGDAHISADVQLNDLLKDSTQEETAAGWDCG